MTNQPPTATPSNHPLRLSNLRGPKSARSRPTGRPYSSPPSGPPPSPYCTAQFQFTFQDVDFSSVDQLRFTADYETSMARYLGSDKHPRTKVRILSLKAGSLVIESIFEFEFDSKSIVMALPEQAKKDITVMIPTEVIKAHGLPLTAEVEQQGPIVEVSGYTGVPAMEGEEEPYGVAMEGGERYSAAVEGEEEPYGVAMEGGERYAAAVAGEEEPYGVAMEGGERSATAVEGKEEPYKVAMEGNELSGLPPRQEGEDAGAASEAGG